MKFSAMGIAMTDVITSDTVASVSLADADKDPTTFAEELGNSFVEYGFAIIRDHGIPQELIDRAEQKSKEFFALPEEVKKEYFLEGKGGARGYTPFGIETAKGHKAHDLKEFWHVGRELPAGHKYESSMPPNVWPSEVASFKDTMLELYEAYGDYRSMMALAEDLATQFVIDMPPDPKSREALATLIRDPLVMAGGSTGYALLSDQTFEYRGVFGRSLLVGQPLRNPDWYLKSITYRGENLADVPFDFGSSETFRDIEVVVSAGAARLTGRATDERGAGNIECNRVAILRFEGRTAFAKVEPRLIYDAVRKHRSQRGDCRKVSQFLNTCAREIVLAQRLVLRLDLDTGDLARVITKAETELVMRSDHVVQPERVERCIVSNRKHPLQVVQRSERYKLARSVDGTAGNRRA